MNPVYLSIALFLSVVVFTILAFAIVPELRKRLKDSIYPIIFIALIAFLAKYPFFQHYFFGLEYEDSYVYAAYARSLLYFKDFSFDPFLTTGCTIGSLINCNVVSSYSGHLITYPSTVYFFILLFGYSPTTILYFNLCFSIIAAILIYLLATFISKHKPFGLIAAGIFALTPIMSVFHSSGLSESFSSMAVLLFLYLYFSMTNNLKNTKTKIVIIVHWTALIAAFIFATLIKRENLVLIAVPIITIVYTGIKEKSLSILKYFLPLFITMVSVLLFYKYYIDLNAVLEAELPDVNGFPFNIKFVGILLPLFLKSFFTFEWFTFFTPFCIAGLFLVILNYKKNPNFVIICLILLLYLALYTSHYRSYYFVRSNTSTTFETLRYITNLFPYYCLLCALPLFYIYEILVKKRDNIIFKYISFIVIIFISIGLLLHGQVLKKDFSNIEMENRILPMNLSMSLVKENDILITAEPLLFQTFANPNLSLISLYSIGKYYMENELTDLIKNKNVYYFKKSFLDDAVEINRHPETFKLLGKYKQVIIKHTAKFELIRLYYDGL